MINLLYSILTHGKDLDTEGYYYKKADQDLVLDEDAENILTDLFSGADADTMAFVAYVLCYNVRYTQFYVEIKELDPHNTYTKPVRGKDTTLSMAGVEHPLDIMNRIITKLDADIRERLQAPTWLEFMGGVCLHLLRSVTR